MVCAGIRGRKDSGGGDREFKDLEKRAP